MRIDELEILCERYLEGRILFVPRDLKDKLENEKMRVERRESIYLAWTIIRSSYFDKYSNWRYISYRYFEKIASKNTSIHQARNWLDTNGFIYWDRSYVSKKAATQFNPARTQAYRMRKLGPTVVKELKSKSVLDCFIRNEPSELTPVDYESVYARQQLDRLEPDYDHLRQILRDVLLCYWLEVDRRSEEALQQLSRFQSDGNKTGSNEIEWNNKYIQALGIPLLKLISKSGIVGRGNHVNRLYTPWATLMREFRDGFSFGGQSWVNLDLTCSQPTLLAYRCEDEKLISDCLADQFYGKIADVLNVKREAAKKAYCAYAYGRNRTENASNKPALAVQDFMKSEYPQAASYVWDAKEYDHRTFIRSLQNREAAIFIDGIHAELRTKKIPALTIHDSILTTSESEMEVEEIMKKHLNWRGISQKIKKDRRNNRGRKQETHIVYMLGTSCPKNNPVAASDVSAAG